MWTEVYTTEGEAFFLVSSFDEAGVEFRVESGGCRVFEEQGVEEVSEGAMLFYFYMEGVAEGLGDEEG